VTEKEHASMNDLFVQVLELKAENAGYKQELAIVHDENEQFIDVIRWLYSERSRLNGERGRLKALNDYLQHAVDLLSLPRPTVEDIKAVRDGLLLLQAPVEVSH
jgi:hypothetical protein